MITYYASNKILDAMFGNQSSISLGSTCYLGLSSTEPQADGTGVTEPSGNGYSRVLLGNASQPATKKMGSASSGAIKNNAEIHFTSASGSWGTLTYAVVYDAPSGGTLLASGRIVNSGGTPSSISPETNSVVVVKVNGLNFSITGSSSVSSS